MKTVSGKIVATTPISLSKASKVLSNFVAADTAASQTVSAYLHRATAAFDELVQLHKDLKQARKAKKEEGDGAEKHGKKRKVAGDEERESGGELGGKKKKKKRIESEE